MADKDSSPSSGENNHASGEDDAAARRAEYDADRAHCRASARARGAMVLKIVAAESQAFEDDLRDALSRMGAKAIDRPARARTWKGPHHGETFRDPAKLEAATQATCAAGFETTWGYALTEADVKVFRMSLNQGPWEERARKAYSELRDAIAKASALGEQTRGQSFGPASIALGAMLGQLPELPALGDLPHYVKSKSVRGHLVEHWQGRAQRRFARTLTDRELAEISIRLGVWPALGESYAALLKTAGGKMTASAVVDKEVRRIASV